MLYSPTSLPPVTLVCQTLGSDLTSPLVWKRPFCIPLASHTHVSFEAALYIPLASHVTCLLKPALAHSYPALTSHRFDTVGQAMQSSEPMRVGTIPCLLPSKPAWRLILSQLLHAGFLLGYSSTLKMVVMRPPKSRSTYYILYILYVILPEDGSIYKYRCKNLKSHIHHHIRFPLSPVWPVFKMFPRHRHVRVCIQSRPSVTRSEAHATSVNSLP
jgi:hypothetical protein